MVEIFQVGNQAIQADEILSLLHRYELMPQFLRGIVIDQAIANVSYTPEERQAAIKAFCQQHQLMSPEAQAAWLQSQGITLAQLEELAIRPMLLEKFKTATWGPKVESYFLTRKASLDCVVYSGIRIQDFAIAQEVYFRIKEGEQSFNELAQQYSQGLEAHTGGVIGPRPMSLVHPAIARILLVSQPGQLWPPIPLAEWFAIIRLEQFLPARLDEPMRHRLIDELFQDWLEAQVQQVPLRSSSHSPESRAIEKAKALPN